MCYLIITSSSLAWFLLTLIADMLVATAIVTPKWLIGPRAERAAMPTSFESNATQPLLPVAQWRYPSVGIYTRCKVLLNDRSNNYHCGRFDLDGYGTDSDIYPTEWKCAMFFGTIGLTLLSLTVLLTLVTYCRQSAFGKSLHNITSCAQVIAAICIILTLFLHPLGWRARRVQLLCGMDAEPFYPAACNLGSAFYCACLGILCTVLAAIAGLKAESSNMRTKVRRRVEEGHRLICMP